MPPDARHRRALMRFYEAEARYAATRSAADRELLLATLHHDVVLHQPASLPYGGEWRGRDGFGRWLDAFLETWTDVTPIDPMLYPCDDTTIVSTVTMRATARSTATQIEMPMCQVIHFVADRPSSWWNFAWDTALMLDALGVASPGTAPRPDPTRGP